MHKVVLKQPIKNNGKEVTELTFRNPTLGDLQQMEECSAKGDIGKTTHLMELLTGIRKEVLSDISIEDFAEVNKVITPLFAAFLPTGEN